MDGHHRMFAARERAAALVHGIDVFDYALVGPGRVPISVFAQVPPQAPELESLVFGIETAPVERGDPLPFERRAVHPCPGGKPQATKG